MDAALVDEGLGDGLSAADTEQHHAPLAEEAPARDDASQGGAAGLPQQAEEAQGELEVGGREQDDSQVRGGQASAIGLTIGIKHRLTSHEDRCLLPHSGNHP